MSNETQETDTPTYCEAVENARRRARSSRLYGIVLSRENGNEHDSIALHLCDARCGCTDRIFHVRKQDVLAEGDERLTDDGRQVRWFDVQENSMVLEEVYIRHTVVDDSLPMRPSPFDGLIYSDPVFAIPKKIPIAPVAPTPIAPVAPTPITPVGPTPIAPVGPTPIAPVAPTPIVL
jgi:hypothetical protein